MLTCITGSIIVHFLSKMKLTKPASEVAKDT